MIGFYCFIHVIKELNLTFTNLMLVFISIFSLCVCAESDVVVDKGPDIIWHKAAELPRPEGFAQSIGISGAYSAFLGEYLIVAGGANFPTGHPFFQQGKKQFYSDIFVFKFLSGKLELLSRGHLPIKAGHGATLVVDNSLYLVGGKNNEQAFDSIIKLSLDDSHKPEAEVLAKLPFTWESGGAGWQDNNLYLFAGKQNGQLTKQVCKYSFRTETCIDKVATPALPGLARSDFPAINQNGHFYLFGGLNLSAGKDNYVLNDAYAFNYQQGHWQRLTDIKLFDKPYSVAGGGAAKLSDDKVVLLGGVNREIFNNAILQLTTLKGDDLQKFKQYYFSLTESEVNFSRQQVIYDIKENSWKTLANKVPFIGGAGPLTISQNEQNIFWISGEVKPVIRSPNIYLGSLAK